MKELIKRLLLLAVGVIAMTSCSNDEDLALQDVEETAPIWITEDGHFDIDLYNASITDSAWYHGDYSLRLKALNVPEEILPALSTDELLYACYVHPLLPIYIGVPNPLGGVLGVIYTYNCYQELLKREDFREVTAEYVISNKYIENFNNRHGQESEVYYRSAGILILLDQDEFIKGMDKSIAKKLLNKCLEYKSSEYLYNYPLVYFDQYNEDGSLRASQYVIDCIVNRLTEYLQD